MSRRAPRLHLGMGQLAVVLVLTVVTASLGIYKVHQQYQVIRLGYLLDQDRFDLREELETYKRLRLSVASYEHPTTVTAMARKQLDMRPPRPTDELLVPAPSDTAPAAAAPPSHPPGATTAGTTAAGATAPAAEAPPREVP